MLFLFINYLIFLNNLYVEVIYISSIVRVDEKTRSFFMIINVIYNINVILFSWETKGPSYEVKAPCTIGFPTYDFPLHAVFFSRHR